ncbi:glycosyltransferase [Pseudomonas umsongensis]|uniref:glycosyltransferase n=1 Tax=Pseudomonas umsongensis TaxID=198618 RepID=UPI003D7FED36
MNTYLHFLIGKPSLMKQEKHILVLTPEIPFPVFKGNQSRIDQTLKVLLEAGHKVSLAILNFNQEDRSSASVQAEIKNHYPTIEAVEVRRHPRFNKQPANPLLTKFHKLTDKGQVSNRDSCPDSYKKLVHQMVKDINPSHILVNYVKLDRAIPRSYSGIKIVDTHDIQTNIINAAIKSGTFKKQIDMKQFEAEEFGLLSKYDYVISINPNETREIKDRLPEQKILTLPAFNDFQHKHIPGKEVYDILFVGSASPFNAEGIKNFIRHCLPAIRKAMPSVRLAIAGEVSNIASVKALKNDSIIYLGRVENLTHTYAASKVVVSPIVSGAGMKVKNIEAFSHGMPLVATSFSMDGIEGTDGVNCIITDDNSSFSAAVLKLLTDNAHRAKISKNAYLLARSMYSKSTAAISYNTIINNDFTYRPELMPSESTSASIPTSAIQRRTKALIYSSDADYLISYKLALAENFKKLGIYSEFITMDAARTNRFLSEGYLAHATRPDLDKKKRASIKTDLQTQLDTAGKIEINLKGVNITDDLNTYKEMFPEHFEGKKLIDVAAHAILILDSILRRIAKTSPDFIVGWNGNGPHFIFLMKVAAKISNLPIFHVERGLLPDTLVFDPQGVNFKSYIAGSYLPLLNNNERAIARKYIEQFATQGKTIVGKDADNTLSRDDVLKRIGLAATSRYIFFPMQIEGDSNIILNSPIYKKMIEVIDDLKLVSRRTGIKIVCRPHPENTITLSELKKRFPSITFDNSLHLHTMLKHSVANVIINSTVGLESILLERPTIALGHSVYSGKGITLDAFHKEHIEQAVRTIITNKIDNDTVKLRTEALVHQLFSASLIRLDNMEANRKVIESALLKNGVVINNSLAAPKPAQMASQYMQYYKNYITALGTASKIEIRNMLEPETYLWLNGNTRPLVTEETISAHFKKATGAEIKFINNVDERTTGESNSLSITIVSSKAAIKPKAMTANEFYVDEYFYPVTA